jgi:hypothetical protein
MELDRVRVFRHQSPHLHFEFAQGIRARDPLSTRCSLDDEWPCG